MQTRRMLEAARAACAGGQIARVYRRCIREERLLESLLMTAQEHLRALEETDHEVDPIDRVTRLDRLEGFVGSLNRSVDMFRSQLQGELQGLMSDEVTESDEWTSPEMHSVVSRNLARFFRIGAERLLMRARIGVKRIEAYMLRESQLESQLRPFDVAEESVAVASRASKPAAAARRRSIQTHSTTWYTEVIDTSHMEAAVHQHRADDAAAQLRALVAAMGDELLRWDLTDDAQKCFDYLESTGATLQRAESRIFGLAEIDGEDRTRAVQRVRASLRDALAVCTLGDASTLAESKLLALFWHFVQVS